MDTSAWIATQRDDGETVGYLEPVTADYARVQPRNLLGHAIGEPSDFLDAEEVLASRGIAELAERWMLRDASRDLGDGVLILEVSPEGIVVAHADLAKAGVFGLRVRLEWPDTDQLLHRPHDGPR